MRECHEANGSRQFNGGERSVRSKDDVAHRGRVGLTGYPPKCTDYPAWFSTLRPLMTNSKLVYDYVRTSVITTEMVTFRAYEVHTVTSKHFWAAHQRQIYNRCGMSLRRFACNKEAMATLG